VGARRDPRCAIEAFKQRLIEALRAGFLDLSRADLVLVQAMPADKVRASEIEHLNATFHFIRVVDPKAPW